jgi:hypothetical protein
MRPTLAGVTVKERVVMVAMPKTTHTFSFDAAEVQSMDMSLTITYHRNEYSKRVAAGWRVLGRCCLSMQGLNAVFSFPTRRSTADYVIQILPVSNSSGQNNINNNP